MLFNIITVDLLIVQHRTTVALGKDKLSLITGLYFCDCTVSADMILTGKCLSLRDFCFSCTLAVLLFLQYLVNILVVGSKLLPESHSDK